MAWTAPRTWVTGELVTAAMLNTDVRDNMNAVRMETRVKEADTSRANDATPSPDPDLTFPILANEVWVVTYNLGATFGSTPGMAWHVHAPTGATGQHGFWFTDGSNHQTGWNIALGTDASAGLGVGGGNIPMLVFGYIANGATPGDVEFFWAQSASDAEATVVELGSNLIAHRIAA